MCWITSIKPISHCLTVANKYRVTKPAFLLCASKRKKQTLQLSWVRERERENTVTHILLQLDYSTCLLTHAPNSIIQPLKTQKFKTPPQDSFSWHPSSFRALYVLSSSGARQSVQQWLRAQFHLPALDLSWALLVIVLFIPFHWRVRNRQCASDM